MKLKTLALATIALASSAAFAAPITLQSDSVKVTITDYGVMNSLGYDPTATGNFPANKDYVAPGIPHEGFGVNYTNASGASVVLRNGNSGTKNLTTGSVSVATGAFDYGVTWTDGNNDFSITHLFFFNDGDERVNIQTTFTALTDLTDVRVSRAVDPDPDNYSGGSAATNNQRGIAADGIPVEDFVGSLGVISGYPLGLFYSGATVHNTGIVSACCSVTDPDVYLAGGNQGDSSTGDHGIGIGFSLGDFLAGESFTWSYAYVMGGSLDTIDIPDDGTDVPEPGTLALLAGALGLLGAARRRA